MQINTGTEMIAIGFDNYHTNIRVGLNFILN